MQSIFKAVTQYEVSKMLSLKTTSELNLSLAEKMVLMTLTSHVDENMKCFPSLNRLAELSGVTVRTVSRAITKLRDLGYISVEKRQGLNNGNISNLYTINWATIAGEQPLKVIKGDKKVVAFSPKKGFVTK